MRCLQIGSGRPEGIYSRPPWVNVDVVRQKPRGCFAQASGARLPFRDCTFQTIHAIHVLEHLGRNDHGPMLLEMRRVLAPGGAAYIEVPDFIAECRDLIACADRGDREGVRIRTVGIYGKGRTPGDWHHWGWSPWRLEELITECGMRPERQTEMISGHHRQQPVLLYKAVK